MPNRPPEILLGAEVQLRKAHPCGGDHWRVTRVGADIGLTCLTCGRALMLDRLVVERRLKRIIEAPPATGESPSG